MRRKVLVRNGAGRNDVGSSSNGEAALSDLRLVGKVGRSDSDNSRILVSEQLIVDDSVTHEAQLVQMHIVWLLLLELRLNSGFL